MSLKGGAGKTKDSKKKLTAVVILIWYERDNDSERRTDVECGVADSFLLLQRKTGGEVEEELNQGRYHDGFKTAGDELR